jgi:hypothetical protein
MRVLHSAAFGLALTLGATGAHAQNVISRQIINEPVETTVTETPSGTVITRRPLGAAPVAPAPGIGAVRVERGVVPAREIGAVELQPYGPPLPPPGYPPYPPPAATYAPEPIYVPGPATAEDTTYVSETVGTAPRARTVTTRRATSTRTSTRATHTVRRTGSARTATRTAERRTVRRTAPLVLDPAQRRVIYRTVVREQVIPAAPAYPARIVVPPVATTGYAVTTPAEDFDDVYAEDMPPAVYPAPRYAVGVQARYAVGAQLPAGVVLTPLPATAAMRVPAVRPYSYVTIDNRVLLVDPVTNTVVADITP